MIGFFAALAIIALIIGIAKFITSKEDEVETILCFLCLHYIIFVATYMSTWYLIKFILKILHRAEVVQQYSIISLAIAIISNIILIKCIYNEQDSKLEI